MARKPIARLPSPYYILRVDQIPTSVTLYELLTKIAPYSHHIIGIARTADYHIKRLGRTIYFYCTSLIDARFISQSYINFVDDGRDAQACTMVNSVLGRASLSLVDRESRFSQTPVTVHVKGLERRFEVDGSTHFLLRILPQYEIGGVITAFRLNYDVRRRMTRDDGFITFLNEHDGRAFGGEFEPMQHTFRGRVISCLLSDNVPMLVGLPDSHILVNGLCHWTADAERVNQLIIRRTNQTVQDSQCAIINRPSNPTPTVPSPKSPIMKSVIICPTKPVSSDPVPSTSSAPFPASGKSASRQIPPINGWLKSKNKTQQHGMKKATGTTIQNKKRACKSKKEEIVYDSSEEEVVIKTKVAKDNLSQRVTRTLREQSTAQIISAPDSEDDSRLIIDEQVELPEEEESTEDA
jgi:hypothetical protein